MASSNNGRRIYVGANIKADLKQYVQARKFAQDAREPEQPWQAYQKSLYNRELCDLSPAGKIHDFPKSRSRGSNGRFRTASKDVKRSFLQAMELLDEQDRLRGRKPGI